MTDGLIEADCRAKFSRALADKGIHGISCVIVIFGDPHLGPSSCDISVGTGVFAVVPNCAFLFCNQTNGNLRVLQTKGCFNSLLKGSPHPVFESKLRWDGLPEVFVADFATVNIPEPRRLHANEVALQGSEVISMDDLFANRLAADQVSRIFENEENLHTIAMTAGTREQQDRFHGWVQEQTIRPDDPSVKPRVDQGSRAGSLFTEVANLVHLGQTVPRRLLFCIRAAYRANMAGFLADVQAEKNRASKRHLSISTAIQYSDQDMNCSPALSPVSSRSAVERGGNYYSATLSANLYADGAASNPMTPSPALSVPSSIWPPGAPMRGNPPREELWGSWESTIHDSSLFGLLYTQGMRSTTGSFKGTCPVCGAHDITLAWLFRTTGRRPETPGSPGRATEGFPDPGSRIRLAFPLAMGHFAETSGVLVAPQRVSTPIPRGVPAAATTAVRVPALVCDPCSVFYARDDAPNFGVVAALPLVRYAENREAVNKALSKAFQYRFADDDLPQVFLSVLLLALQSGADGPRGPPTPASLVDIDLTMKTAAADNTFRKAVEWAAQDLLQGVPVLRELSAAFSQSVASFSPRPTQKETLGKVLASSFEEAEMTGGLADEAWGRAPPLLLYPLVGFVVMLPAAAMVGVRPTLRHRAAFRRLLYLVCEEMVEKECAEDATQALGELLGEVTATPHPNESPSSPKGLTPLVRVSSLWTARLISTENYRIMRQAEEFRTLDDDESYMWVSSGLTLFLRSLFTVRTRYSGLPLRSAWELFEEVTAVAPWNALLQRPEEATSFQLPIATTIT
ncbi:hypothetical protein B0T16DRAFT_418085 [Cercophora newfieldiana]|uniref:Uncharacterized protein n=1 Tax=Cercophora newfieldiana TaxID=92897 RepID=A0AA39Y3F0_9PEZI|nr:hypothetical protein B0T16DRAFT_418085 [Cercophora newfieldiana]